MGILLYSVRSKLRPIVTALAVGLACAASARSARAEKPASSTLEDSHKTAVLETLDLVKAVLADQLNTKMSDLWNNPGQPNIEYETVNGQQPTLGDGINKLYEMLAAPRIEAANSLGGLGRTDPAPGTHQDHIYIDKDLLDRADNGGLGGARNQLLLAGTLLNEMVAVFQRFEGDDAKQCDAERDSQNATLLIIDAFLNALTVALPNGQPGPAHTSIAAVAGESPALASYLAAKGIPGHSIPNLASAMRTEKSERAKTLLARFTQPMAAGKSWGPAYYGAERWHGPLDYRTKNRGTSPHSIEVENADESQTVQYFVPAGWDLINSAMFFNEADEATLMALLGDPTGARALEFWTDVDTDGLPEPNTPSPLFPLTAVPPATPELDGTFIYNGYPIAFGGGGPGYGLLLLDTQFGRATLVDLATNGLAIGTPLNLFEHPMLTSNGSFVYFAGHAEVATSVFRFIFSDQPPVAQFDHVAGAWFDYDLMTQQIVGSSNGSPQTLAQSFSPKNDVGIQRLEPALSNAVRLQGNPGSMVQMFKVSGGFMQPIANGMVQQDGATSPLNANPPLSGSSLYAIRAGQSTQFAFLPRLGHNVACASLDETGDGADERIQMSVEPTRLHIMAGLTGLPPNSVANQYAFEQVVEHPAATAIRRWQIGQPRIMHADFEDVELTPINAVQPPLYVASLVDMNGDLDASEAVAIYLDPDVSPNFVAQVYSGAGARGSGIISTLMLPGGFEPDGYRFDDLNLDGALDVATRDFFTGEALRLFNDGDGVLFFVTADNDSDDDGDVDLIDYAAFADCHAGPNSPPQPAGDLSPTECLEVFDHDADVDVDLADGSAFQREFDPSARAADQPVTVIRRSNVHAGQLRAR